MAINRYPIHSKTKGSLGENEDTWVLLVDSETGERTVEHWWHHMNPYKGTLTSEGEKILTLAEFEASEHGGKLAAAMSVQPETQEEALCDCSRAGRLSCANQAP